MDTDCTQGKTHHYYYVSVNCDFCDRMDWQVIKRPCLAMQAKVRVVGCAKCENGMQMIFYCKPGGRDRDEMIVHQAGKPYKIVFVVENEDNS